MAKEKSGEKVEKKLVRRFYPQIQMTIEGETLEECNKKAEEIMKKRKQ